MSPIVISSSSSTSPKSFAKFLSKMSKRSTKIPNSGSSANLAASSYDSSDEEECHPPSYYDLEDFADIFGYEKVTPEIVEARMKEWDMEQARVLMSLDQDMEDALKKMGL